MLRETSGLYWRHRANSFRMTELQAEEASQGIEHDDDGAINLPTMEVARTFAVETIDFPDPLGVHQVHRWLKDQMVSLDEWCPEYKLVSPRTYLLLTKQCMESNNLIVQ